MVQPSEQQEIIISDGKAYKVKTIVTVQEVADIAERIGTLEARKQSLITEMDAIDVKLTRLKEAL